MAVTLKAARVNVGLTQVQASKALGISLNTLIGWEKGVRFPNVPQIKNIEKLYGVGFDDIIFLPNSTI